MPSHSEQIAFSHSWTNIFYLLSFTSWLSDCFSFQVIAGWSLSLENKVGRWNGISCRVLLHSNLENAFLQLDWFDFGLWSDLTKDESQMLLTFAVQSLAQTYRKDKKQSYWIKLSNIYLFGKTCSDLWRWHVVGHLVLPIPWFLFCMTAYYKSHTFCKFPLHLHYYIHLYRT